jgi:hypothetical protein
VSNLAQFLPPTDEPVGVRARIAEVAGDILDVCEGLTPQLFYAALVLATGTFLKATYPHDLEDAFNGHKDNLRNVLEELDKKA